MDNTGYAFLKADQHGLYRKAPELRKGRQVKIETDNRLKFFELLHGVPVVWRPAPRILVVRGREDSLHAVLDLITGQTVATFSHPFIKTLWRMGASLTIEAEMTNEVADSMVLFQSRPPKGTPALYELRTAPSGVAASA